VWEKKFIVQWDRAVAIPDYVFENNVNLKNEGFGEPMARYLYRSIAMYFVVSRMCVHLFPESFQNYKKEAHRVRTTTFGGAI
jgi:hypothetical protein